MYLFKKPNISSSDKLSVLSNALEAGYIVTDASTTVTDTTTTEKLTFSQSAITTNFTHTDPAIYDYRLTFSPELTLRYNPNTGSWEHTEVENIYSHSEEEPAPELQLFKNLVQRRVVIAGELTEGNWRTVFQRFKELYQNRSGGRELQLTLNSLEDDFNFIDCAEYYLNKIDTSVEALEEQARQKNYSQHFSEEDINLALMRTRNQVFGILGNSSDHRAMSSVFMNSYKGILAEISFCNLMGLELDVYDGPRLYDIEDQYGTKYEIKVRNIKKLNRKWPIVNYRKGRGRTFYDQAREEDWDQMIIYTLDQEHRFVIWGKISKHDYLRAGNFSKFKEDEVYVPKRIVRPFSTETQTHFRGQVEEIVPF